MFCRTDFSYIALKLDQIRKSPWRAQADCSTHLPTNPNTECPSVCFSCACVALQMKIYAIVADAPLVRISVCTKSYCLHDEAFQVERKTRFARIKCWTRKCFVINIVRLFSSMAYVIVDLARVAATGRTAPTHIWKLVASSRQTKSNITFWTSRFYNQISYLYYYNGECEKIPMFS